MKPKEFAQALPTPIELVASIPAIEPVKAVLDRFIPPVDRFVKHGLIEIGCFVDSALRANNPNLVRTFHVHALKKRAVEDLNAEDQAASRDTDMSIEMEDAAPAIRVTPYEVMKAMRRIDPKWQGDIKTVQRHMEAEVATGDLLRDPEGQGYIYRGFWTTLALACSQ